MRKNFALLLVGTLFGMGWGAWAQSPTPTPKIGYAQALQLLKKGSRSLDREALTEALRVFQDCPAHKKDAYPCPYRAAEAGLYLVRALDLQKHRDQAEKALTAGIQSAQAAVSLMPDSPDSHALLARLYEQKLLFGDMFTGMDIGPKAGAENRKALELGPKDPQVQLALGIQYVMAPPIGGGDVKKGIATLEGALALDPKMDEAYYWLAKAYRKQNDRAGFEEALRKGRVLNPDNPLFQAEQEAWKP
ncbi:MAG TPA: tetratricopeptide repeat protein [bacterium]|nr:tetratricopeptide repeat protein [bacterium]